MTVPLNALYVSTQCMSKSSRPEVFCRKGVLRYFGKFTGKHLCHSLFFSKVAGLKACNFTKKEAVAQVFSCKFCQISKNTFSYRIPLVAASVCLNVCLHLRQNVSCVKFMKSIELDTKFAVSLILKSLLTSKNKIKAHLNWVNWNF